MNLEALFSALTAGRTKSGVAAGPEPHAGLPGFQDWLQEATEPVSQLPGREKPTHGSFPQGPTEKAIENSASRRAAALTPVASEGAIAFAERPLLVETSLQFGSDTTGLSSRVPDIRWTAAVLEYRIGDLLEARIGDGSDIRSMQTAPPLRPHSGGDHQPHPADKRLPVFRMIPHGQTALGSSPLSMPESDGASESAGPRSYATGGLAARLLEHIGRAPPNGPVVHLHPEQDGLWRLLLRLPKLAEGTLAELREELKNLAEAFGLKLGTFEIVETRTGEEG